MSRDSSDVTAAPTTSSNSPVTLWDILRDNRLMQEVAHGNVALTEGVTRAQPGQPVPSWPGYRAWLTSSMSGDEIKELISLYEVQPESHVGFCPDDFVYCYNGEGYGSYVIRLGSYLILYVAGDMEDEYYIVKRDDRARELYAQAKQFADLLMGMLDD